MQVILFVSTLLLVIAITLSSQKMKLDYLLLAITSILGSIIVTPPILAQCIQADIAVQYNISGSTLPTERDNDVRM